MIKNEIAVKYSQALLDIGKENNNLVDINKDLNQFWEIVQQHEDLKHTLFHQRILPEEKKAVLKEIFGDEINKYVLNFLKLLIDKRRIQFIEFIIKRFKKLVNKQEHIMEVEVISAISLEDNMVTKLKQKLDQFLDYKVIIKEKCDPSIIGGLVLKIGNYIIDGSIENRLTELEEKLDQIPVSELGV